MMQNQIPSADQSWTNSPGIVSDTMQDNLVSTHFQMAATFWDDIYLQRDVYAVIHQQRRAIVLSMVNQLRLPRMSEVLDIGCGAGSISVALASRGLNVTAVDKVPRMLERATDLAAQAGVSTRMATSLGDIHRLPFPNHTFSLVLAIGVLPWLTSYEPALQEIARVLKPGGHLIVNIDNRWALHRFFDPGMNFLLAPLKALIAGAIRRVHSAKRAPANTTISPKQFRAMLDLSGFEPSRGVMFGFGPFSVFRYCFIPNSLGLRLSRKLQALCDEGLPIAKSTGAQFLVMAQKR
jgi:ubiquinone/menaquinone biosynthesis C-methylase UbiE